MKTQKKLDRKINPITPGRWTAYMAAAAATSFAAAGSAEGEIHYSGLINVDFRRSQLDSFPLDPAGGVLIFEHNKDVYGSSSFYIGGTARAFVQAPGSASMNGYELSCSHNPYASASVSNLARGAVISQQPFVTSGGVLGSKGNIFSGCGANGRGQFLDRQKSAFIGFKFNNGAGVQYGWARLSMKGSPFNRFRLVDYAYGDPGDTIVAGQTSNGTAPTLESLGSLALGAAGLLALRKSRGSRTAR